MRTSKLLGPGYLFPRIIVALFVLDLILRFFPLNTFAFRVLEAAQRRTLSCIGPFESNTQFHLASSYGDLSSMGNLPKMRVYHSVTFTTDALGFHNPKPLKDVPQILVIGDSFALASEVPENRSLAAQLTLLQGQTVFNAAEEAPLTLGTIRAVTQQLRMRKGYILYEFLERHLTESPPLKTETGKAGFRAVFPMILGAAAWDRARLPVWHFFLFSPLEALSQKLHKRLCNDQLLPNRYSQNVAVRRLVNGDTLLFSPTDLADTNIPLKQSTDWVDYWGWLASELQKDRLSLVVLLVPNKYTVYEPFFSPLVCKLDGDNNLHQLERMLDDKGIVTANLVDLYRGQAAVDLNKHVYLYWKDDTHWNERGMRIAAESVQRVLARNRPTAQPIEQSTDRPAVPQR